MALFVAKVDPRVPMKEVEALFAQYGQRHLTPSTFNPSPVPISSSDLF